MHEYLGVQMLIDSRDETWLMQEYEFTVEIVQGEDGRYVAICPALQGCYTEGETEEEARQLIADAIRLHVLDRLESGSQLPEKLKRLRSASLYES